MTAETVLTDVLAEIGLDRTSPQISASDYEMSQIRAFMNQAGEDIAKRGEWSKLYKTETVAGSVSESTLPSDFQEMGEKGAIYLNKSGFTPVRIVIDPTQWAFVSQRESAQNYAHITDGKVKFSPALDSDGAKFTYVSENWVFGDKAAITQNSDTFYFPERLLVGGTVWRWFREKGRAYDDRLAEFEADLIADIQADRGQG